MRKPASNNLLFAKRNSTMPVSISLDDLSKACIPSEYLRSLCGNKPLRDLQVTDLNPSLFSTDDDVFLSRFIERENMGRSIMLLSEDLFNATATEFVINNIGTVLYLTPATIALAQIRNTLRGSPSVLSMAEEADYVFIGDLVSDHQRKLFDAEPTSAAHFYEFLRAAMYGLRTKIVYGHWRVAYVGKPSVKLLRESLSTVYTDSLVDLIVKDLVIHT